MYLARHILNNEYDMFEKLIDTHVKKFLHVANHIIHTTKLPINIQNDKQIQAQLMEFFSTLQDEYLATFLSYISTELSEPINLNTKNKSISTSQNVIQVDFVNKNKAK